LFLTSLDSGAATTASRLGQPDLAIATLNDFVQSAQMVCSLDPTCPVIADADTGFGGPAMVARTVTQYARSGVAGLHIEDQVQTKRCGHLLGKQVVSREEFVTRIRAAVIARDSIPGGSDFVIIGRTDSAQVLGMEEAIMRLKLAADAGADVCFIEGVKSKELLESTVKALAPKPVSLTFPESLSLFSFHRPGSCQRHLWWSYPVLYLQGSRGDGCQDHQ
jgi:2-methylisocitrate lyase-like PEP mutase family enzyme